MSQTQLISAPSRPESAPACHRPEEADDNYALTQGLLREIAMVLHATRRVRESLNGPVARGARQPR
jgi:hypothetical protein